MTGDSPNPPLDAIPILDAVDDALIVVDAAGRLVLRNRAARTLLGLERHAGHWSDGLTLSLVPGGPPLAVGALPLARALGGASDAPLRCFLCPPDQGASIALEASARPMVDAAGQPAGALLRLVALTPMPPEALERQPLPPHLFVRALRAINNGVTIVDAQAEDMPLVYVNPGFLTMTGYTRDEVIGRNCRFLQGADTDPGAVARMRAALRTGRDVQVVVKNYRKDGQAFWNQVGITAVRNHAGTLTHFVGLQQDVTAIIDAEQALRKERDFIQIVLDAMPTLFFMLDRHGHLLAFNARLAETTGYDADDLRHMTLLDFLDQAGRERAARAIEDAFASDQPLAIELAWITKAGARIPVYCQAVRRVHDGQPVLFGSGQDVSEYRALLESLTLSEERLSRSQAFANIGLWDWNIETDGIYWSDRVPELLGVTESRLNFGFRDFFASVHPIDRLRLEQVIERCISGNDICDEEFRVQWLDGTMHWMLLRANVVHDFNGDPVRMLGVVQDISALKHAEFIEKRARHQVQAIIDSLTALICVVDETGAILSVNRSWQRSAARLSDGPRQLGTGDNYLAMCDRLASQGRADLAELARGARQVLASELNGYETEIRVPGPAGTEIHLARVTPLHGATEDHPRVVINHQDITRGRQAAAELLQAKEEAERASQAKSEFLSSMSHELRTPMNAVLGFAQLLEQDEDLNDDQLESVQEILRAGKHLLTLINDVLDLARVESGHVELSLEPIVLSDLIPECIALLVPLAKQREVELSAADSDGVLVRGDRVRLKQVLVNLLSNGVKYNRAGGSVRIAVGPHPDDAGRARLCVIDTGLGIPASELKNLFQPFTRLSRDASEEGTGIGLAVCHRLVEAMQGTIGVTSEPGKGSRFWIDLPVAATMLARAPRPGAEPRPSPPPATEARRLVLQIEDNPANLKLLERLLSSYPDLRLISAPDAAMGLKLARARDPDLILLDINMPDMDGYETLAALRADATMRQIPVVALTANATARDIERGLAAGFDAYLTKPIDIGALMTTLTRLLDAPGAGSED